MSRTPLIASRRNNDSRGSAFSDSQPLSPGLSNARGFQSLREPETPMLLHRRRNSNDSTTSSFASGFSSSIQSHQLSSSGRPTPTVTAQRQQQTNTARTTTRSSSSSSKHHHHAAPLHRNVFYAKGVEDAPNPLLHYMHIGVWYSRWCDFYQHRKPVSGEIHGLDVLWLHNARPRDRFVFLVRNVEGGAPRGSFVETFKQWVYGASPRFGIEGRREAHATLVKKAAGVEIIEIPHANITALDYAAGLVSTRFAIEASEVTCSWYASENEARYIFGCQDVAGHNNHNNSSNSPVQDFFRVGPDGMPIPYRQPQTPPLGGSRSSSPLPSTSAAASAAAAFAASARSAALSGATTPSSMTPAASAASAAANNSNDYFTPPLAPSSQYNEEERRRQQQQQQRDAAAIYAPPPPSMSDDDDGFRRPSSKQQAASSSSSCQQQQPPRLPPLAMPPPAAAAAAVASPPERNGGREPATAAELAALTPTPAFGRDQSMQWAKNGGSASSNIWSSIDAVADANMSAATGGEDTPPVGLPRCGTAAHIDRCRDDDDDATREREEKRRLSASAELLGLEAGSMMQKNSGSSSSNKDSPTSSSSPASSSNSSSNNNKIIIRSTIVTLFTQDPNFNAVIREIVLPGGSPTNEGLGIHDYTTSVEERLRLLRMTEAGIPAWCIFCTRYGIFYRRSLRVLVAVAINFWPLVALGLGLYDLYSHMPYVHQYLVPLFSLIEDSLPFRVALYVAYFFTYVLYFMQWVATSLRSMFAVVEFLVVPFAPLMEVFWPLVQLVVALFQHGYALVGSLVNLLFGRMLLGTVMAVLSPLIALFRTAPTSTAAVGAAATSMPQFVKTVVTFWKTVASPIKNVFKATYDGIIHVGSWIARHEASLRMWYMRKFRRLQDFVQDWWQVIGGVGVVLMLMYWLPVAVGWLWTERASSSSWGDVPLRQ